MTKILNKNMYHGAALSQIAESDPFTSINKIGEGGYINAFRVNDDIGIYLKYASKPKDPYEEYGFTFTQDQKDDLKRLRNECPKMFIVLICIEGTEICCISHADFTDLVQRRTISLGYEENSLQILVTLRVGKSFRVYVNRPNTTGEILGKAIEVAKSAFPKVIFK